MERFDVQFLGSVEVPCHQGNGILCAAMQKVSLESVVHLPHRLAQPPEAPGLWPQRVQTVPWEPQGAGIPALIQRPGQTSLGQSLAGLSLHLTLSLTRPALPSLL